MQFPRRSSASRPLRRIYGILGVGARGRLRDAPSPKGRPGSAREASLKDKIHPKWFQATVVCACGNTFVTGSTLEKLHVEICSACHPFFTGKQKFVDTEGRVEKFITKYGTVTSKRSKKAAEPAAAPKPKVAKAKAEAEPAIKSETKAEVLAEPKTESKPKA